MRGTETARPPKHASRQGMRWIMNILNKISIKNLKLNKKRTISTIVGIILSTALICATANLGTSFQKTLVENAINETGYYHLNISDINPEDIEELRNSRNVKEVMTVNEIGYSVLEGSQNEYKPYVKVFSMNNKIFKDLKFNLVEGTFPKNGDEILISKHIIQNGHVNYKVGDKITLNIGERRTLDNQKLNSSSGIYTMGEEKLVDTEAHTFKIVGIIERPNYNFEDYSEAGYTVITTDWGEGKQNAYITLKNAKDYKNALTQILGAKQYEDIKNAKYENSEVESEQAENGQAENGQAGLKYKNFSINGELLRWEAFAFSDSTVAALYTIIGIVIFIIIITSVFCIRNSFAISVTEKIKMYSMLSSVGATKKQIRKNVLSEAFMLGIIGIPIGIVSGFFAVFVLLKIVNLLLGDFLFNNIDGIVWSISPIPVILSIVFGFLTIYLSAISAARKASKINPIEGLRNSENIQLKSKELKTPKIIKKIFKTGGTLAYKNLKRSKKKYRTTVISLAVSIFVFIAMNVVIVNAFDLTGYYYEDYDYNIRVSVYESTEDQIEQIKDLDNINKMFVLYTLDESGQFVVKDLSRATQIEGLAEPLSVFMIDDTKYIAPTIVALDDASFREYAKKIGVKYENVKTKGILCDEYIYYDTNSESHKTIRLYNYNKDDVITGYINEKEVNITVGEITNVQPYGYEQTQNEYGYLVLNAQENPELKFKPLRILIESDKPESVSTEIDKIIGNNAANNMDASVKEERAMVIVIKIFLYGFLTVITLISVTNIFNTITSNMELRQKEFAMLKSVGMTKKEFNKMIYLETIFYCTKALLYGVILGLIATFAFYKAFSMKLDSGLYLPINPIIISAIAVFVLVFVIMRYSIKKINNQNTIETIRKDNV